MGRHEVIRLTRGTAVLSSGATPLDSFIAVHNNTVMNAHARSRSPSSLISSAPGERPGKRARRAAIPGPLPDRSGLFCCPASASPAAGASPAGGTMAAPGQRIHPAGSRLADPRHAARRRRRRARSRAGSTTPAASASSRTPSGARSHEVVRDGARGGGARGPPRRRLDRQLGRRRGPPDPDPAPALLSRRLPPRPAPAARPAVRRRRVLPAARARGARRGRGAWSRRVLAEDGIPFLGWRDVPDQSRRRSARRRWRRAR